MAGRPWVPLSDFPLLLGPFNEDPDAHVQLFEVICGAHGIVDDGRKSCIFPATLRGDASEWYANLCVHKRTTYDDMKTNFLRKFRGLGFEENLAEELDHLRQGATESIEKYIDRMDTIVRKLGDSAPDRETLKRRFLVGLDDGKVEEYIRLKRPLSLEEVKHEARIWKEVQCVLRLHRDRLSSPSRSLEENQESTMVVDINEKKEMELLDKLKGDMFAKVEPTCLPIGHMARECLSVRGSRSDSPKTRHDGIWEQKINEYTTKVRESHRGDISKSPCLSPNFEEVEVSDECRPKMQSKPRRKIVVNQSIPEVGVIPQVQTRRCKGRPRGDERPMKQEPILAREKDGHKNNVIIMPKVVDAIKCEALEDVGLQCKVKQLEYDVEKLRDIVSHLESELAQEKECRIQEQEKVKELERETHKLFKDVQHTRDKENVEKNKEFQELMKRWKSNRKIQREKIVREMEKHKELERKVEVLMERLQSLERTKINKTSKGKEGRLGSQIVELKECRTKKEIGGRCGRVKWCIDNEGLRKKIDDQKRDLLESGNVGAEQSSIGDYMKSKSEKICGRMKITFKGRK
ncbi:hypothetical protein KP509_12G093900 [Ceratopteris richardii]|uniref:Retrotransposon gag domain-containing protein n=1 Tax=Ceratopteris richardii TaxID=49495 RepID=A0A8T2TN70_CERRI|nr:hypothetical protein KP509_12G093900 [Ceratopteris richardii]